MIRTLSIALLTLVAAFANAQSVLLIPDSANDRVAAFSPVDGSVIDLNFIPPNAGFVTPINALDSGRGTVFVTDQFADTVLEFAIDGTFIGTFADISQGLDNIRGAQVNNGSLFVTVGDGALEDTIQQIDIASGAQSTWASTNVLSPFDIIFRDNDVLVSTIDTENIESYDLNGNFLSTFHDSDGVSGIDFPEQIPLASNGDVLVAGFSSPAGIYRYDSVGNQIGVIDVGTGVRGVYELQNGNILWTAGTGVFSLDPATGISDLITDDGSWRFIENVTVPEPGGFGLLLIGAMALVRRRP